MSYLPKDQNKDVSQSSSQNRNASCGNEKPEHERTKFLRLILSFVSSNHLASSYSPVPAPTEISL
ncbi:hypothetical protein BDV93DRAFT_527766 [Ceratobasidium sp. AG-I]|nr:hypothetical protein BDV93DRAFT_527766 [Ceratobasidium sp. AG-I]